MIDVLPKEGLNPNDIEAVIYIDNTLLGGLIRDVCKKGKIRIRHDVVTIKSKQYIRTLKKWVFGIRAVGNDWMFPDDIIRRDSFKRLMIETKDHFPIPEVRTFEDGRRVVMLKTLWGKLHPLYTWVYLIAQKHDVDPYEPGCYEYLKSMDQKVLFEPVKPWLPRVIVEFLEWG